MNLVHMTGRNGMIVMTGRNGMMCVRIKIQKIGIQRTSKEDVNMTEIRN